MHHALYFSRGSCVQHPVQGRKKAREENNQKPAAGEAAQGGSKGSRRPEYNVHAASCIYEAGQLAHF